MAAKVARLGHVGLFAVDLERLGRFYVETLGMTVTDGAPEMGRLFLSARPDEEHHEVLLVSGRAPEGSSGIQQLSFFCDELSDVVEIHRRLVEQELDVDMVVSHGNAIGVYFFDPEGNRCEVYCHTGIEARQPYLEPIDLARSADEVLASVRASVTAHDGGPYTDQDFVQRRREAAAR